MTTNKDYIRYIRGKVGHDLIFLNFAGGIVYNERNEILQKRGDRNEWGLPGGAMELGESLEETAKREIFEETGLNVEVEHLIGVYSKYSGEFRTEIKLRLSLIVFNVSQLAENLL